jgi:hypothetical protein
MSKWKSVKHFTSWLGLAPENEISGGKLLRTGTKKVKSRANLAFRQAAMGVSRGQSVLGVFYRRIRAKHGPMVAIVATAHKIARIFYAMLKDRREYISPDTTAYDAKQKERAASCQASQTPGGQTRSAGCFGGLKQRFLVALRADWCSA